MRSSRPWALPRRYSDRLRYGWPARTVPKRLRPQRDGLGNDIPGTAGWAHHSSPGFVLRIVQIAVQQQWTDEEVRAELMKPINVGSLWLRRHDDPDTALADMLARVDRGRRPLLPMRERHLRIMAALRQGEVLSQKALLRAVDHPSDRDVRADLRSLAESGAITMEPVVHGRQTWWQVSISTTVSIFWDLALEIRKALERKIGLQKIEQRVAELWRRAQGCLSSTGGRTRVSRMPPARHAKARARPGQRWRIAAMIERSQREKALAELSRDLPAIMAEGGDPSLLEHEAELWALIGETAPGWLTAVAAPRRPLDRRG